MSYTQKIIPQAIMPVYNQNIFAVYSTNITKERYNYIFDLYDYQHNFLSRVTMPARPDGYALFDSHRIMENYVSYDFDADATGYTHNPNSFCTYKIKFGEQYVYYWPIYDDIWSDGYVGFYSTTLRHYFNVGDKVLVRRNNQSLTSNTVYEGVHTITEVVSPYQIVTDLEWGENTPPGTNAGTVVLFNKETTKFTGVTETNDYLYCINAVKKFSEFNDWNYDDYDILPGMPTDVGIADKKLLTNIPYTGIKVRRTDKMWLSFMSTKTYGSSTGIIKTYDASGNLLGQYKTYNSNGSKTKIQERFAKIAIGPVQLNNFNASNTWPMTGTFPILTDAVKSYSFNFGLYNFSDAPASSKTYTFTIDDCPALWSTIRLVFLDRMGSFVGYNFRGGSRKDLNITRTNYRKDVGTYTIPTTTDLYSKIPDPDRQFTGSRTNIKGDWGYKQYDKGLTTIDTSIDELVTIYSAWETQEIGDWLSELATSPAIYQQFEDGTFSSIVLEDMQMEVQKRESGNLIGYEFRFRYSNKSNVQRG